MVVPGGYRMVSMSLNTLAVQLEPGGAADLFCPTTWAFAIIDRELKTNFAVRG
jgi:hypothetical protein